MSREQEFDAIVAKQLELREALKRADADMQRLMNGVDPKLSDVLAPAFEGTTGDEVGDALLWWGRMTGKLTPSWMEPDSDITVRADDVANLREAARGLSAVSRISRILRNNGGSTAASTWVFDGLEAATCALAGRIDDTLEIIVDFSKP